MEHSGKGLGRELGALSCKMSVFATNSQGHGEDCIGRCQRGIPGLGWMGSVPREPSTTPGARMVLSTC